MTEKTCFGFNLEVITKRFRVSFSFLRCLIEEPNLSRAKNETRTTKFLKKNNKNFQK